MTSKYQKAVGKLLIAVLAGLTLTGCEPTREIAKTSQPIKRQLRNNFKHKFRRKWRYGYHANTKGANKNTTPDKQLAEKQLTSNVRKTIHANKGVSVQYKGGSFIINHNEPLIKYHSGKAYAKNIRDEYNRVSLGKALASFKTRQFQDRNETGNGASDFRPAGFEQLTNLPGKLNHAYDRGHLLGYAIMGRLTGFDASESNPDNIATQTMWANEANRSDSRGQAFYEMQVLNELDHHRDVIYRVQAVYNKPTDKVPYGNWVQAQGQKKAFKLNVFIPNVQPNLKIDYGSGRATIRK